MLSNPYITPGRIRAALQRMDVRPTKGMGQNFLTDQDALDAIVAAAELQPDDIVLEVGPGLGVLTWELVQRVNRVVAVELDRRLAERLQHEFPADGPLSLIQRDILNLPPGDALAEAGLPADTPYKLVANLPYAITSAVLRHMLEAVHRPTLLVVLVQREVAERIVAAPGDLSVLAHSVQIYAEAEIVAHVPASSFVPAPRVDSSVLRLRTRPALAVDVPDADRLLRVIKAGFLQARKKLSNSLPGGLAALGTGISRDQALAALATAGVDANRRAETVTLDEWARVYHALYPVS